MPRPARLGRRVVLLAPAALVMHFRRHARRARRRSASRAAASGDRTHSARPGGSECCRFVGGRVAQRRHLGGGRSCSRSRSRSRSDSTSGQAGELCQRESSFNELARSLIVIRARNSVRDHTRAGASRELRRVARARQAGACWPNAPRAARARPGQAKEAAKRRRARARGAP